MSHDYIYIQYFIFTVRLDNWVREKWINVDFSKLAKSIPYRLQFYVPILGSQFAHWSKLDKQFILRAGEKKFILITIYVNGKLKWDTFSAREEQMPIWITWSHSGFVSCILEQTTFMACSGARIQLPWQMETEMICFLNHPISQNASCRIEHLDGVCLRITISKEVSSITCCCIQWSRQVYCLIPWIRGISRLLWGWKLVYHLPIIICGIICVENGRRLGIRWAELSYNFKHKPYHQENLSMNVSICKNLTPRKLIWRKPSVNWTQLEPPSHDSDDDIEDDDNYDNYDDDN